MEFLEFPKMARLTRECIITEKIDGTNAQIGIVVLADNEVMPTDTPICAVRGNLLIYAGSRSRWCLPNPGRECGGVKYTDNFGFAQWVEKHADEIATLGPGRHFGEWWGSGIQRGYGLTEKRFSLFNTSAWADRHMGELVYTGDGAVGAVPAEGQSFAPPCCHVVPVLYRGVFHPKVDEEPIARLRQEGSIAAPGFMKPEGIVVYHVAAGVGFKKTLEKDEQPKGISNGR